MLVVVASVLVVLELTKQLPSKCFFVGFSLQSCSHIYIYIVEGIGILQKDHIYMRAKDGWNSAGSFHGTYLQVLPVLPY